LAEEVEKVRKMAKENFNEDWSWYFIHSAAALLPCKDIVSVSPTSIFGENKVSVSISFGHFYGK